MKDCVLRSCDIEMKETATLKFQDRAHGENQLYWLRSPGHYESKFSKVRTRVEIFNVRT
jgi:hypothetical protein